MPSLPFPPACRRRRRPARCTHDFLWRHFDVYRCTASLARKIFNICQLPALFNDDARRRRYSRYRCGQAPSSPERQPTQRYSHWPVAAAKVEALTCSWFLIVPSRKNEGSVWRSTARPRREPIFEFVTLVGQYSLSIERGGKGGAAPRTNRQTDAPREDKFCLVGGDCYKFWVVLLSVPLSPRILGTRARDRETAQTTATPPSIGTDLPSKLLGISWAFWLDTPA